jgi:hypothetical protein
MTCLVIGVGRTTGAAGGAGVFASRALAAGCASAGEADGTGSFPTSSPVRAVIQGLAHTPRAKAPANATVIADVFVRVIGHLLSCPYKR